MTPDHPFLHVHRRRGAAPLQTKRKGILLLTQSRRPPSPQEEDRRQRALAPYLVGAPKRGVIGKSKYAERLRKQVRAKQLQSQNGGAPPAAGRRPPLQPAGGWRAVSWAACVSLLSLLHGRTRAPRRRTPRLPPPFARKPRPLRSCRRRAIP